MARNPFNFSFKTFTSIYNELKARYPDKPDWFIVLLAGQFDKIHWYLDARAENLLLSSAYTPEAILNTAAMLDYYPSGRAAGGGLCRVTITGGAAPITIPREELAVEIVTATGARIRFEAVEDLTISSGTTGDITFYEGEYVTGQSVGISDGLTEWQSFLLPEPNILMDTIEIVINSVTWNKKTTLVNSTSSDRDYRVVRLPNGFSYVEFGDGTYGEIPGNFTVFANYRRGGGVRGNILSAGATVNYIGDNASVVSVAMLEDFTGGSEGETLERTRFLAPKMLKTQERAVTQADYELLSLRYSTSIVQARCFPGLYGEATVGVHLVPAGGGNPSTGLKTALESYLVERSTLGLSDVRVRDPFYQAEDITAAIKIRPGYTFAVVQEYAEVAAYLLVSETVKEILDIYAENGIAEAVSYLNTKWGYSFTSSDYATLTEIIERRQRDGFNTWGDGLRVNDIISALDAIPQVDYVTVSTPASDVTVLYTDILTEGTITITEIT